jgi:hypothetical protein
MKYIKMLFIPPLTAFVIGALYLLVRKYIILPQVEVGVDYYVFILFIWVLDIYYYCRVQPKEKNVSAKTSKLKEKTNS